MFPAYFNNNFDKLEMLRGPAFLMFSKAKEKSVQYTNLARNKLLYKLFQSVKDQIISR